jgi:hypothetical protein
MRTHQIGNRMRAFALSTAFAIFCSVPPAVAAQFDGNWSMVAVTTSGHCGSISIGLGISRGRVYDRAVNPLRGWSSIREETPGVPVGRFKLE